MIRTLIVSSFLVISGTLMAQNVDSFSGIITYTYTKLDGKGNKGFFPIDIEEVHLNEFQMLTKVIKGQYKAMVGNKEVVLDSKVRKRYEVDHDERSLKELKEELTKQGLELTDWRKEGEAILLGDSCKIIVFKRENSDPVTLRTDFIIYTYYISKTMKWNNPEILAGLQGNQNTKLLDGREKGIPLKIVMEYSNGEKLITEAVKIQKKPHQFFSAIPDYPLTKEQ